MKNLIIKLAIFLLFVAPVSASAQTLDSTDFAFKGLQTNLYSKLYDFAIPDTGYNIVWNYASNMHESYYYSRFSKSKPDNCFGSTYPDFEYSTYFMEYDSLNVRYGRFYKLKESGLILDGILDCGSGFTLTESTEIPLPISYNLARNETSIDDYHGEPADSKYQVNSSFEVIGYGTLYLPNNLIYENSFLIKTTLEKYRIEYDGHPSSGDTSIVDSYKWYCKGTNTSVLSYNGGDRATYLSNSTLNNVGETTVMIKPTILLTSSGLTVQSHFTSATLVINDVLGRELLQVPFSNNVFVPTNKLNSDILIVTIKIKDHVFTEKLVKARY
jgi:hypothetical protein